MSKSDEFFSTVGFFAVFWASVALVAGIVWGAFTFVNAIETKHHDYGKGRAETAAEIQHRLDYLQEHPITPVFPYTIRFPSGMTTYTANDIAVEKFNESLTVYASAEPVVQTETTDHIRLCMPKGSTTSFELKDGTKHELSGTWCFETTGAYGWSKN